MPTPSTSGPVRRLESSRSVAGRDSACLYTRTRLVVFLLPTQFLGLIKDLACVLSSGRQGGIWNRILCEDGNEAERDSVLGVRSGVGGDAARQKPCTVTSPLCAAPGRKPARDASRKGRGGWLVSWRRGCAGGFFPRSLYSLPDAWVLAMPSLLSVPKLVPAIARLRSLSG